MTENAIPDDAKTQQPTPNCKTAPKTYKHNKPTKNVAGLQFLTANDLMQLLGVGSTTFWKMRRKGQVPKPVTDRPARWLRSHVEEFYHRKP